MLAKIRSLVKAQFHFVLATSRKDERAEAVPHASLMAYCASADCREFWLATLSGTQKRRNLAANPRASLLIDDRAGGSGVPGLALTVEAELEEFPSPQARQEARAALLARHPGLAALLERPDGEVLRLVARRYQLLSGLTDVFSVDAEKMLDG